MDLHLLPRGKTDFAQPIDAGFGRVIKLYMGEEMEKWLDDDDNLERWESNALSASHRRILLLTHWFGDAFIKRAPENWDQVTKYWKHTGGLMTINGRDFGSSKLKFEGVSKENLDTPESLIPSILPSPCLLRSQTQSRRTWPRFVSQPTRWTVERASLMMRTTRTTRT